MCQYCGVDTSTCGKVCGRGIEDKDRRWIVERHNELRKFVAEGNEKRGAPGKEALDY